MSSLKKNDSKIVVRSLSDAASTMPFLASIPTIIDTTGTSEMYKSNFERNNPVTAEDRYSDIGLIGKGGMGEVRRVYDKQMQRMAALKVLHSRWSNKPKIIKRFEEEARLTARLQHPGIVPVHEIGELSDGRIFFTMPVILGETLAEVTKKVHEEGRVSPSKLRQLIASFYQASQTIAYVHKEGVLHRDIKPSNIMVGEHGATYVMDWGLAQIITDEEQELDSSKAEGGTPSYMAPELIDEIGMPHLTSDVYALGATLYKILCGQPPYSGTRATEIMQKVLEGPPKPLNEYLENGKPIPAGLIRICEKAMSREPQKRFKDAQSFCDALIEWRDGDEKRRAALQIIQSAEQNLIEIGLLKQKSRALHRQGHTMLQRLRKDVPEEKKYSAWKLLDESKTLSDKANLIKETHVQSLNAAIAGAPDLQVGHMALADFYRKELMEIEKGNDPIAVEHCKHNLKRHASALSKNHPERAELFRFLRGDGEIDVMIEPCEAEIEMEIYYERHRRLIPEFTQHMGRQQRLKTKLGMGSYRFRIQAKNAEPVLFPVLIDRLQRWSCAVPGQIDHLPLRLLRKGSLGTDDIYIPGGWYWSGGPQHETSLPKRRVWVDSFIIRKRPVTNREYLIFLNDLLDQGREDDALRHVPRERSGTFGAMGALIYGMNSEGRFYLAPDADGDLWQPDWPVVMIDWHSSYAYAQWLSAKTGLPWRLPYEMEREKASRGADGRDLPWGNSTSHSWSNFDHQNKERALLSSVYEYPKDESPYGVTGCAGNVFDWCMDAFSIDGPELFENRFLPMHEESNVRTIMGASWRNRQVSLPVWYRDYREDDNRNTETGFRLARPILPEDHLQRES